MREEIRFKMIKCVFQKNNYRIYRIEPLTEHEEIQAGANVSIKGNLRKLERGIEYGAYIMYSTYDEKWNNVNLELKDIYDTTKEENKSGYRTTIAEITKETFEQMYDDYSYDTTRIYLIQDDKEIPSAPCDLKLTDNGFRFEIFEPFAQFESKERNELAEYFCNMEFNKDTILKIEQCGYRAYRVYRLHLANGDVIKIRLESTN